MKGEVVAKRYALALTHICKSSEDWESIRNELLAMVKIFKESDELKEFMENPIFPKNWKINVILRISEGLKISEKIKRFLTVVVDKGRFSLLSSIYKNFEDLWFKKNNIYKLEIVSAIPLDEEEKSEILDTFAKIKKGSVKADFKVDPEILGGVIIREGNKIYDCSIKGNLEKLKNKIAGGESLWK